MLRDWRPAAQATTQKQGSKLASKHTRDNQSKQKQKQAKRQSDRRNQNNVEMVEALGYLGNAIDRA